MSLLLGQVSVAHFVEHEQTRRDGAMQPLPRQARMRCTRQGAGQVSQRRKEHRIALRERLVRKDQAQMRHSCSWRTEQYQIGAGAQKRQISQLAQAALGEGGLKRELEAIE